MSLANFSPAVVQNNSVTTVTAAMRTIKWMVQYVEDPDVNADDGGFNSKHLVGPILRFSLSSCSGFLFNYSNSMFYLSASARP